MRAAMRWARIGAAMLVAGTATGAGAQSFQLQARLDQAQEVPATGSPATGFGTLLYNAGTGAIDVTLSFQGLTGNTVPVGAGSAPAHVHFAPPGVNGPIVIPLIGMSTGATFFNNYVRSYTFAELLSIGVTTANVASLQTELNRLMGMPQGTAANLYFNVHTTTFGGGEIRGNLAVVPEPSTYVLMASGLVGVGLMARRRRS